MVPSYIDTYFFEVNPQSFFVMSANTTQELKARTVLAALVLSDQLTYSELDVAGEKRTIVHPSYVSEDALLLLQELSPFLPSDVNQCSILVSDDPSKDGYLQQFGVATFPCGAQTAQKYLTSWLKSNKKFLEDRPKLKATLMAFIREQSTKSLESVA